MKTGEKDGRQCHDNGFLNQTSTKINLKNATAEAVRAMTHHFLLSLLFSEFLFFFLLLFFFFFLAVVALIDLAAAGAVASLPTSSLSSSSARLPAALLALVMMTSDGGCWSLHLCLILFLISSVRSDSHGTSFLLFCCCCSYCCCCCYFCFVIALAFSLSSDVFSFSPDMSLFPPSLFLLPVPQTRQTQGQAHRSSRPPSLTPSPAHHFHSSLLPR